MCLPTWRLPPHCWLTWGSQGCLIWGTRGNWGMEFSDCGQLMGGVFTIPLVICSSPYSSQKSIPVFWYPLLSAFSSWQHSIPPLLPALHCSLPRVSGMSLFLPNNCLSPPPIFSFSSAPLANSSPARSLALPQLLLTNIRICMICLLHDSFINLPALCSFNLEHKLPRGTGPCPLF